MTTTLTHDQTRKLVALLEKSSTPVPTDELVDALKS